MRHQNRHRGALEGVLGEAAKYPFTQSAMAVTPHHDQSGLLGGGAQEGICRALRLGPQMSGRMFATFCVSWAAMVLIVVSLYQVELAGKRLDSRLRELRELLA